MIDLEHDLPGHLVHAQGAPLFYRDLGLGQPLLLLHAGIADGRMWRPQWDALGDLYRLIIPDLKGFGRSPLPNNPFVYHEDLAILVDHLALGSVWLVGTSFGSRVGLDFYLTHRDRVRGLILVSPVIGGFEPDSEMRAFGREEDRLLAAGDLSGATELNMRMWLDGPRRAPGQVDPALRLAVAAMQLHAFQIPLPEYADVIALDPPALGRLDEVRVPTLIIAGALDVGAVLDHAQLLADAIAGASLEILEGTAHLPNLEKPAHFSALIDNFIEHTESLAPDH